MPDMYKHPAALGDAIRQAQDAATFADELYKEAAFKSVLEFLLRRLEQDDMPNSLTA